MRWGGNYSFKTFYLSIEILQVMAIDYFILGFLLTIAIIVFFLKMMEDRRSNSSNNDGGLPVEIDLPELDLPPGVTLPVDGPSRPVVEKEDRVLV